MRLAAPNETWNLPLSFLFFSCDVHLGVDKLSDVDVCGIEVTFYYFFFKPFRHLLIFFATFFIVLFFRFLLFFTFSYRFVLSHLSFFFFKASLFSSDFQVVRQISVMLKCTESKFIISSSSKTSGNSLGLYAVSFVPLWPS